jgi:hypothetical protein
MGANISPAALYEYMGQIPAGQRPIFAWKLCWERVISFLEGESNGTFA